MQNLDHQRRPSLFAATALTGTLSMVTYLPAMAEPAASPQPPQAEATVGEVIVTASRRNQDITKIPYNISAVSARQIERTGITNLEDLAFQVPNVNITSNSDRFLGAQRVIIRGLNASDPQRQTLTLEQPPVTTYLGNSPFGGFFPIQDVDRVEVLRGPQGTLYGAGALAGTIRIIPQNPVLNVNEGLVSGSVGTVAHSSDVDYSFLGVVNLPLGNTIALRAYYDRDYQAGFIDQLGVMVRNGSSPVSPPVLANPADVANSPAVYQNMNDVNWTRTDSGRVALKWEPSKVLEVTAAYNVSSLNGNGGPVDNPNYQGGPDPFDPRIVYPATGPYQIVLRGQEPYSRLSQLGSLDVSYDVGFATLSSTSSYFDTHGDTYVDGTYATVNIPPAYIPYYAGNPINPRYNAVSLISSADSSFSQELRAVSNGNKRLGYVLGAFYQEETVTTDDYTILPGSATQAAASGGLPIPTAPGDVALALTNEQKYTDKAVYGQLTWNVTDALHLEGGVRFFHDDFSTAVTTTAYVFYLWKQHKTVHRGTITFSG